MRELTLQEYRQLKNTVYVLRMSRAPLTPDQQKKVERFERTIAEYEKQHGLVVDFKSRAAGERD